MEIARQVGVTINSTGYLWDSPGESCHRQQGCFFHAERIGTFLDRPIVRDDGLIITRDTVNSPAFVRELCSAFDLAFIPKSENILASETSQFMVGQTIIVDRSLILFL